jgi:hypothetical protein
MNFPLGISCPKCGSVDNWTPRPFVNRGGHITFPFICVAKNLFSDECGYRSPFIASKDEVDEGIISYIPMHASDKPTCERCGVSGAEYHHWAPKYLFEDTEKWPGSYLCISCHQRWHDIVTPQRKRA